MTTLSTPTTTTSEAPTMSKKDIYVAKMKLELDALNIRMQEIEAKAKEAKDDAKARYQQELAKLRDASRVAGAKLDDMQAAAEGSWHQMVAEMEKLRHAFTSSFAYFKSQL
jgi:predicted  nucleic acid-binding Zn-ribbon protein